MEKPHDLVDVSYKETYERVFPTDAKTIDAISAKVKPRDSSGEFESTRVRSSNPLGIELVVPDFLELRKGLLLDVQLQVARQSTSFEGIVVDISEDASNLRIAGVRLFRRKSHPFKNKNRRNTARWLCSSQYYPVATCPNPAEFNDFLYLRIKDLSATGFRAITSLRNKFLVPGMELSLQISFPMIGHISTTAAIARADLTAEEGKDYLELGLKFGDTSKTDRATIGQYLNQFGESELLDDPVADELGITPAGGGLNYKFVKTETEFEEAIKLRRLASKPAVEDREFLSSTSGSDIYDARSRIISWNYRGRCVCTARVTFCDNADTLPIQKRLKLPAEFPRNDQIAELSAIAIHPDFRAADLIANVLQRCSIICLQAKRSFMVIAAPDTHVGSYEQFGLTDSGLKRPQAEVRGRTDSILYGDIREIVSGKTTGIFTWSALWKPVLDYTADANTINTYISHTSRLKAYNLLAPLAGIARYFLQHPRKKKIT